MACISDNDVDDNSHLIPPNWTSGKDEDNWATEMLRENEVKEKSSNWESEYSEKYQHPRVKKEVITASAPDLYWAEEVIGLDSALEEMRSTAIIHEARRMMSVLTYRLRMRADEASLDIIEMVPFSNGFSYSGYEPVRYQIDKCLSQRGLTHYSVQVSRGSIRLQSRPRRRSSSVWSAVRFLIWVLVIRLLYRILQNQSRISKFLSVVPLSLVGR